MLITDGSVFIIDSSNRQSGTDGNFYFVINIPKDKGYDSVCLLQAMIPKSYYLVQAPYNTFTLTENGVDTTLTITAGNYNVRSWSTLISALLTNNSSQGWTYSISFPNATTQVDTGLFTYSVTGNSGIEPSFTFPEKTASSVYEQFGFAAGSTNTFTGDQLTSTNVVKFQQEDILYLHSDISYNNDQSLTCDVLQEFYASSTQPFSNITYENQGVVEGYSKKLKSANNNVYHFTFTNENQQLMDFNGLNNAFSILVYKKNNISDAVQKFIAREILKDKKNEEAKQQVYIPSPQQYVGAYFPRPQAWGTSGELSPEQKQIVKDTLAKYIHDHPQENIETEGINE